MLWHTETLLRSHWNKAMVDLVKYLGPENVHISLLGTQSSDPWDNTMGALQELDTLLGQLNVPRSFMLDNTTHEVEMSHIPSSDEPGWVWTRRGKKELRRIPFLANSRNRVMAEIDRAYENAAERFDKVLWLNDVVFTTEDVVTLLATNGGEYAAACSLDFAKPPSYYDTFALRDISGAEAITLTWPYFLSSTSRHALIRNDPVPVQSCWNGMVAMEATPFYEPTLLRFRGIADGLAGMHLEGCECCLIHADNPLSAEKGVFLNPNVRVGYNAAAYAAVNPDAEWPSPGQRIQGLWRLRLVKLVGMPGRIFKNLVISWRLKSWHEQTTTDYAENREEGVHCLVDEMQVLVGNGWLHL
jgi:hypothetical protein